MENEIVGLGSDELNLVGELVFDKDEEIAGAHFQDLVVVKPEYLLVALFLCDVGECDGGSVIGAELELAIPFGSSPDVFGVAVETDRLEACRVVRTHRSSHYENTRPFRRSHSQRSAHANRSRSDVQRVSEFVRHPFSFHLYQLFDAIQKTTRVEIRKTYSNATSSKSVHIQIRSK